MRFFIAALALAVSSLTISPLTASAAPMAGAQYAGVLTTPVDSRTGYVGERVTITHVYSEGNQITGATMYGTVTHVVHAGQGRPGQIQLTFTRMVLRDGSSYAIDGIVTGMQAITKNNALKEAGGAVAGMLIGNMLGKTIFHASGGGFLGAAGGFLAAKNNRQDVTVSRGTTVRVTLRSVRRQTRRY
ncbi:MAG: hypothetical protein ABR508_02805 [Candidatus Baltobacteraceae bacterium]